MTKILHTADIHLGAQFKTLGKHAEVQRKQLKKTFHKALETAVQEKVGLVLIAGDLFDNNNPSYELIEFVRSEMNYLKENTISLCIVPGHHDFLDEHGIYNRERFDDKLENVFIFRNPKGEMKEYPDLNLAIFAKPNMEPTSTKSAFPDAGVWALASQSSGSPMRYKILAAHGDLQIPENSALNYHPISVQELEGLEGINYVALGHWHSLKDCSRYGAFKMPVWYSGSPELLKSDQQGAGNILFTDFNGTGVHVTPVRIGQRSSKKLDIDISLFEDIEGLKKKIMEQRDPDLLIEIECNGLNTNNIPLDTEKLEGELGDSFFSIRILDKSHLLLQEIPVYSDALLEGQFVKIMQKKIKDAQDSEKKIYENALQIGLKELEGREII